MTDTDDLIAALGAIQAELKTMNASLAKIAAQKNNVSQATVAYPGRPLPEERPSYRSATGRPVPGRPAAAYGNQSRSTAPGRPPAGEGTDTSSYGAAVARKSPKKRGSARPGKPGPKKGGGYPKKSR